MSSSKSRPCAACKYFRRKCAEECVFAPHFPPDQPHKIETLHKVYGGATIGRILSELPAADRGAAVNSLVYEAEARLRDPVYGCVGYIASLQHSLRQVQTEINTAKQELATYMGPCVLKPGFLGQFNNQQLNTAANSDMDRRSGLQQQQPGSSAYVYQQDMLTNLNQQQSMDLSRFNRRFDGAGPSHQYNQPSYETQQLTEAAREQDFVRNMERQVHQQEIQIQQQVMDILRFNRSFDGAGPSGQASYSGFTHLAGPGEMSPSLPFGGSYDSRIIQQQPQEEVLHNLQNHNLHPLLPDQLLLQQQNQPLQPQPQQEQHDHRQRLIEHQLMLQDENQQSQLRQHPQQEKQQHLQSLLLPHQLLIRDQNQPLQPQPHPEEEHLGHLQQLIPNQMLLQQQKQKQPWQPQPNHRDGREEK
ncbi:hypothetical protein SSX86_014418 [Deinandra increscens subsp. villosa]|uniref:LOB domain-containing protein n=1 Tax=Deinandra increscens subsp. villosa TaxID=3103831 RepID=A0AAP0GXL8_9ASTR